jgi:hypothetical protein
MEMDGLGLVLLQLGLCGNVYGWRFKTATVPQSGWTDMVYGTMGPVPCAIKASSRSTTSS